MSKEPVGILLAAGQSRRFGGNKLLQPVSSHTPMLLASAEKLARLLPNSIAVISPELQEYSITLERLGMRVVVNNNPEQGMGNSIARGVEAACDAGGWLITLADMPYLKSDTIRLLVDRLRHGASIVAPVYGGQRGHPVGFNMTFRDELLALSKDVGACNVIVDHPEALELMDVDDPGVVIDIDKPAELINRAMDPCL